MPAEDGFGPPAGRKDGAQADTAQLRGRCRALESAAAELRAELAERDEELRALRAERDAAVREKGRMDALARDHDRVLDDLDAARQANDALRDEVAQMKRFLRDYGLTWVGDAPGSEGVASRGEATVPAPMRRPSYDELRIDICLLLHNLRELNELVDADRAVVRRDGAREAGLSRPRGLLVEVFRDGVRVGGSDGRQVGDMRVECESFGAFRGWLDERLSAFVRDVMDGYFPKEWQAAYPDGAVLDVRDRTRERGPPAGAFCGEGKRLGSGADGGAASAAKSIADYGAPSFTLSRGAGAGLGAPGRSAGADDESLGRRCRVQVRGGRDFAALVVDVRELETVAQLRAAIEAARPGLLGDFEPFQLRTSYPSAPLDRTGATMQEAGLCPNGVVNLRRRCGTPLAREMNM